MSGKTSAQLRDEIHKAQVEQQRIAKRLAQLRVDLRSTLVIESQAAGHPWLGKTVQRPASTSGYYPAARGIVKLRSDFVVNRFRRGYRPQPGEIYVESLSGKTAYSLNQGKWELVK